MYKQQRMMNRMRNLQHANQSDYVVMRKMIFVGLFLFFLILNFNSSQAMAYEKYVKNRGKNRIISSTSSSGCPTFKIVYEVVEKGSIREKLRSTLYYGVRVWGRSWISKIKRPSLKSFVWLGN